MSSLKSPNILCMEELSLFQLNHDLYMDTNEGLFPHGDCMNPLNMDNKSITIYFSLLYSTVYSVVPLLLLGNWQLSSNCL